MATKIDASLSSDVSMGAATASTSASTSATTASASASANAVDARYTFDTEALEDLRKKSPWKDNAKWFTGATVSPTAIVKMMTHCQSGVEKGVKKGGNPIEVMGLLLGRPDPITPHTLVVTDVFPLPIEGFETRVIADDEDVVNHMIALGESLETTRREKFMGWYHSHPFDLGPNSHCFLSQTDLSTQLQWQRAEDPHGNPFLAMVVDPLRSLAKNSPQLKAFRAYPPEFKSDVNNECPDGSIIAEEKIRLEKWGSCWSRYYELKVDYFMSKSARRVMDILTQNTWMRNLGTTPGLEIENKQQNPERINEIANKLEKVEVSALMAPSTAASSSGTTDTTSGGTKGSGTGSNASQTQNKFGKICDGIADFASERIHESMVQVAKKNLFS